MRPRAAFVFGVALVALIAAWGWAWRHAGVTRAARSGPVVPPRVDDDAWYVALDNAFRGPLA